jgi:hypothetical protein
MRRIGVNNDSDSPEHAKQVISDWKSHPGERTDGPVYPVAHQKNPVSFHHDSFQEPLDIQILHNNDRQDMNNLDIVSFH